MLSLMIGNRLLRQSGPTSIVELQTRKCFQIRERYICCAILIYILTANTITISRFTYETRKHFQISGKCIC